MKTQIKTPFTEMMKIRYPIIGAPMFLVSNTEMVAEISNAGAIGTFPALNFRPIENYAKALSEMREQTDGPIGVNIIVNKTNTRQKDDLKHALDAGVELFITSLGNPKEVIRQAHQNGAKVICDVTNLDHALKVEDLGADGVVAVGSGAGGHAGPISPLVLIPWLRSRVKIPVVAAGGVADGASMAAALSLGASAVHVGTRFIASSEASVQVNYKQAIVDSSPEDIVMTTRISGTPIGVINTPDVQKMGLDLHWAVKKLKDHPKTKKYVMPLIHILGMKALEKSATRTTWKDVWSAGQSVGLVHEILSCREIVEKLVTEYERTTQSLPAFSPWEPTSPSSSVSENINSGESVL